MVQPINGSTKSITTSHNDITVYPWHSLVPFLTTNVNISNAGIDRTSQDPPAPENRDSKEDKDDTNGGSSNRGMASNATTSNRLDSRPSGNNNNVEAKDSDFLLNDDDVFDEGDDFLASPSPTTPTDKSRRSKERIRRPMNAFMVSGNL
jgi:hypothetical protein